MPRKKKEAVFPGYVRVRPPDMEALGALTKQAIGEKRSITEFAEACGLAPSTISRILKAKFTNPVSDGVIKVIAENAESESGVTVSDLLAVHGLAPITFTDNKTNTEANQCKLSATSGSTENTRCTHLPGVFHVSHSTCFDMEKIAAAIEKAYKDAGGDLFVTACQEIIQDTLIDLGYCIRLHKDMDVVGLSQFRYIVPFAFTTDAVCVDKLERWAFEVHDGTRYTLVQKLSWIFGAAYLDRLFEHGIKISLITTDKDEFEMAKQKFSEICIPDCVSIILVDFGQEQVVEEFQIRQIGADAHPSVFDPNI